MAVTQGATIKHGSINTLSHGRGWPPSVPPDPSSCYKSHNAVAWCCGWWDHLSIPLILTPTPLTLQTNATRPQFFPDSDRIHPSHFLCLLLLSKLRGSKKYKTCHNAWWMDSRGNLTDNLDAGPPSVHRAYFLPPSRSFRSHQTKPPLAGISRMQDLAQCGMDPRSKSKLSKNLDGGFSTQLASSLPGLPLHSRLSQVQGCRKM